MITLAPKVEISDSRIFDGESNNSNVHFGSLSDFVEHKDITKDEIGMEKYMNGVFLVSNEKSSESISKPRTALFKGREDDVTKTIQVTLDHDHTKKCIDSINLESKGTKSIPLKFGALHFNEKLYGNQKIFTAAGLSTKITFRGGKFIRKQEKKSDFL